MIKEVAIVYVIQNGNSSTFMYLQSASKNKTTKVLFIASKWTIVLITDARSNDCWSLVVPPVGCLNTNKCATVTHCEINQARNKWFEAITRREKNKKNFMKFDPQRNKNTNASENVYSFNATPKYRAIIDWKTEL